MKSTFKFLLSLRLVIVFAIIACVMLWVGVSKIKDTSDKTMTIYQLIDDVQLDGSKWIKIEAGVLNIMSSYYNVLESGHVEELFIPIQTNKSNVKNEFFLQTKDTNFTNVFNHRHSLQRKKHANEMAIEISRKDPAYLEFTGLTLDEQIDQLKETQLQIDRFLLNHPPIEVSIEGLLNPNFGLSDDEKLMLGTSESIHIIKHGAFPESEFYSWFLLIVGGLIMLMCLLASIGFFLNV
ncbi:MAG: hypothetical protein JKX68_05405 [Flavobacteriales bacterium]|nr:hypothetical protein [Flavobacteriales bacterium]